MNTLSRLQVQHEAAKERYGADNVFVTMLYGSQNYHLDTAASDVDSKTMVLPTFKDFCLADKPTSTEHTFGDGICNVKDVRLMFRNYLKSNINFLETLFTEYYFSSDTYITYWRDLRDHRDFIADAHPYKLMHAAAGMAAQKYHALERPFESKAEVLAKYGYDPKQLHHLCRLKMFMSDYYLKRNFGECLVPRDIDYLISLKLSPMPLEEARDFANSLMRSVDSYVAMTNAKFPKESKQSEQAKEYLDDLAVRLLRTHFTTELKED